MSGLSRAWNAPDEAQASGCSRAAGQPADRPNMVLGINVQVCWDLSARIAGLGPFELITRGDELPVLAIKLREGGWLLPAYAFPKNRQDLAALRVVVERDFTHDTSDLLIHDLIKQLPRLEKQPTPVHDQESGTSFDH